MKNNMLKVFVVLLAFIFVSSNYIYAQKTNDRKGQNPRKHTALFINKTNNILFITAESVRKNKVYTGYLHKAKIHQKQAIENFKKNRFKISVYNSFVARRLAFLAYEANGKTVPQTWRLNDKEKMIIKRMNIKEESIEELKAKIEENDKENETDMVVDPSELPDVQEAEPTINKKTNEN